MKFNNGDISQIALLSRREDEGLGGGAGGSGGSGRSDEVDDWDQRQAELFEQYPAIVASANADMADTVNEMTAEFQRTELNRFDEATTYLSALQAYASSTEEIKLEEIAKVKERMINLRKIIVNSPDGADTDKLDVYYQSLEQTTELMKQSMKNELTIFIEGVTKQGDEKLTVHDNFIKQHTFTLSLMDLLLEATGPDELNDTSGNYLGNIDEDVYLKYDEAIKKLKAEYEESIILLFTDLIGDTEEIDRRTKKLKTSQDKVLGVTDNGVEKEKRKRISKADYAEYRDDLAELILPHLLEYREKEGKDMQRFPSDLRTEILDSYLKDNNLIGRVNTGTFWDGAISTARDGKIVKPNDGGRELGETSTAYENTKKAESNARKCTEDGTGFIERFNGDVNEANEFAQKCFTLREKRKEFDIEHEKLGSKPETAEEAMSKLPRVVEETDKEIQARVIKAFANGGAVKLNVSSVVEHINDDDVKGLADKAVTSMQANPNYESKLCTQNQKNAIKIMTSETCHYFLLVRTLIQMVACGLAIIVEWTDEEDNTFSRIFVSVPDLLLFMYCQGIAKKVTGDANDNVRAPEPTGGDLIIDILNGGKLINMNAHDGEGGFLYEDGKGKNYIFQEIAVTEGRDKTVDTFKSHMPITGVTLSFHQAALATGFHFGICTSIKELYESDRCLHGVLEDGETLSCVPVCPAARSLLAAGIALDPSKRCDGDHTFGRDSIYLQGMSGVQGVEHRENRIRAAVEDKYGYWLNPLVIGKYKGGNTMPKRYFDRRLD